MYEYLYLKKSNSQYVLNKYIRKETLLFKIAANVYLHVKICLCVYEYVSICVFIHRQIWYHKSNIIVICNSRMVIT